MINETEKLLQKMFSASTESVASAIQAWSSFTDGVDNPSPLFSFSTEFEEVEIDHDEFLTKDGREILWSGDKAYALKPEIHNKRREDALSAARERNEKTETKSVTETEELSEITCPKCQDVLQYSRVCPACAAGQAGYHHRYLCVCGVDFVTKERL